MSWQVDFHPACRKWADGLNQADAEALLAAVRVLRDLGPSLGRPLADTVEGSAYANMKELRPGSSGRTEIRVLFAFDHERKAILLVGGDKSSDWDGWYRENIPVADERFTQHRAATRPADKKAKKKQKKGKRS